MKMSYIKLKQYKYELKEDLIVQPCIFGYRVDHDFFSLTPDGILTVKKGYKWDGASGGMWDTKNTMIGGCVHDAGYQMIRLELISVETKSIWDNKLHSLFTLCDMSKIRAGYAYQAVNIFGSSSAIPGDIHIPKTITVEC